MTMKAETMEEFAEDYMRFEDSIHQRFTDFDRAFHHALPERKSVVLNRWKAALEDYQEWIGDLLENFKDMENEVEDEAEWKAKEDAEKERARAHGGITFDEMEEQFVMHNADSDWGEDAKSSKEPLMGVIVFTADSFDKPLPLEARSFRVSSECKAFHPLMSGYSIFGSSLDDKEKCVRLDTYMRDPEDPLKVDYCYLEK